MRVAGFIVGLMLLAGMLVADERYIDFDRYTDFSTLKTFALREGKSDSLKPELNNELLLKKIGDAIRSELTKKGLKETINNPDISVDYRISAEEFTARRGGPTDYTEGKLIIDLVKRDSGELVWRGIYHDNEGSILKFARNLPGDVRKFLSEYPPKQKLPVEARPATLVKTRLTPKTAAAKALEVVQATRGETSYAGTNAHPGLSISLDKLERAARTLIEDDGTRPAATENKSEIFYKALNDAADYASSIADRGVETPEARARSRELASQLRSLSGI